MNDIIICDSKETSLAYTPSKDEAELVDASNEKKPVQVSKKKIKKPKALVILSLVFAGLSVLSALVGLLPLQIFFLALSLIFHMIDRNKNGKRGLSLFSMICTIFTFVIIFITLTYCIILFSFGMYTAFVDDTAYNFIMDTIKSVISFIAGLFGINITF